MYTISIYETVCPIVSRASHGYSAGVTLSIGESLPVTYSAHAASIRKEAMRPVFTTGLAVAIAVGVTTGVSSPAFAQDGTAPACIQRPTGGPEIVVMNGCGKPMRVKVARKMLPDGPCTTLQPGQFLVVKSEQYQKALVCH